MTFRKTHIKSRVHRAKPKKSVFRKSWFWISVLILLLAISITYSVLFYPGLQIEDIKIIGNQKILEQDIKGAVFGNIEKKLFSLVGWNVFSKSFFLVDEAYIRSDLLSKFPAMENVDVKKEVFRSIILHVKERAPVAVLCPLAEAVGICYFMDNNGVVFEPVDEIPAGAIIVRQATDFGKLIAGKKMVEQNAMYLVIKLKKLLEENFEINAREVAIISPLKVSITTNENWKIYFTLGEKPDIDTELAKLNLLLAGGLSQSERENLRYIDLKPKDKAIICDNNACDN